MPSRRPPPSKPKRRLVGQGSVIARKSGRLAVVLPTDLDPSRRAIYGPGRRQKFATVEQATAWLDAEIQRRRAPSAVASLDEPLGAYLPRWWANHAADWPPRTSGSYRRLLRHAVIIGHVTLRTLLVSDDIRTCLSALQRGAWRRQKRGKGGARIAYGPSYPYAPSTIQQFRAVLHNALQDLVPHLLPYNPVKRVRLARRQDPGQSVWDAEQVDTFEATALRLRPDLYFAFRLVLRRALRRGEVLALKADDLDMRRRVVGIDETAGDRAGDVGDTKGRKRRDVPLGELAEDARQHRLRSVRPSRWLFPGQHPSKPLSLRQFNAIANQITEVAKLPKITPKDMRASAATILLDQNVALPRVSRLLGHADISTTSRFYERALRSPQVRVDELADDFDGAFRRASGAETASEESPGVSDEDATRKGHAQ